MSIYDNNIAIRRTVDEYAEARDQALAGYESALKQIQRVRAGLSGLGGYLFPYNAATGQTLQEFTQTLDQRLWRLVFERTEIPRYMDATARDAFNASLEKDPPAFTVENVRSSLVSAASNADEMFARGLYELFCDRPRHLVTNTREPFKLPRKIIWSRIVESEWIQWSGLKVNYNATQKLNDLDRVLRMLAGETFEPHSLVNKINAAWQQSDLFEDDMLKVRGFRNGNAHVWIKRQDVIDRANRVIADYAGPALPETRSAA